jgi:hypothetical protein
VPCRAGGEHEHGANDSLLYHSLLGRFMGNTIRMRPRNPDGSGRGYDIANQHRMADGKKQHGNVRACRRARQPHHLLRMPACMPC